MNALILVDIQNDFLPGGALGVPRGDEVVPVANRLMRDARVDLIVATRDWHPAGHESFASTHPDRAPYQTIDLHGLEQTLWPDHCVQATYGSRLAAGLDDHRVHRVCFKGTHRAVDSYSAFFDNAERHSTGLETYLRNRGVSRLVLLGLATDYCVKFSALDARRLGFDVTVVENGCRAVDLRPGDGDAAFEEMRAAGARILNSEELL